MFKVLNTNKNWIALSIGEEKRFQNYPTHKRHKNLGQISHKKVMDYLSKSEMKDSFMEEYQKLKKSGLSSYDALISSLKIFDPKKFSTNFNTEINGNKFNFCNNFNFYILFLFSENFKF